MLHLVPEHAGHKAVGGQLKGHGNGDGEHGRHAEQHRPHQRSNEAHGKAPWAAQHKAAQQNGKVHRAQHVAHLWHMAGDHGQHKGQCKEQCSQHEAAGGGMGVRFHKKLPPLARQKRGLPGLQANGRPLRAAKIRWQNAKAPCGLCAAPLRKRSGG